MSYLITVFICAFITGCSGADAMTAKTAAAVNPVPKSEVVLQQTDERFEQIYSLDMNGSVKAGNINGSIKITTWDSPQVRLVAVKSSGNPEALKLVDVKVESTGSFFSVKADYKKLENDRNRKWRELDDLKVEFELTVPRTANLDGIATVNGDVSIDGTDGDTNASTVNGTVIGRNLGGPAKLTTVNGTVEADFDDLVRSGDIKLTTVNGQVMLSLPSDANATIKANSLSGSIENDFGLPVRKGEYVGRDMHGRIGSGDVQIKMSSVSGSLSVSRKNDGRQMNPVTNLLRMRDDADDDTY